MSPSQNRTRRLPFLSVVAGLLPLAVLLACSSPNRGVWRGEFSGSVSGVVEFRINARGTRLTGSLEGETRGGQPFKADMEGKIQGEYFYATLEGAARTDLRPIPFEGFLKGEIRGGAASGDWEATPRVGQFGKLEGRWQVEQLREGE